MSYFLGAQQPAEPVGYWLKPHAHADVACLVTHDGPELLRTACGEDIPKATAIQGVRGVRLCEACMDRVRARIASNRQARERQEQWRRRGIESKATTRPIS